MTVRMFSKHLLFIAFLVTPITAMFCDPHLLYFYIIYPFTALIAGKWNYFKAVALLIIPPVLFFVWAYIISPQSSSQQSLRWIVSITSGVYFAAELGASGISSVLRSMRFSFADKLADIIGLGGKVILRVKPNWSLYKDVDITERVVLTVENSLADIPEVDIIEEKKISTISLVLAFFSWLITLVTISGVKLL